MFIVLLFRSRNAQYVALSTYDVHDLQVSLHYYIGVNINERKSGTEPTKKRKKRELVCFSHRQGAQRSTSPRSVRYMDFARATITRDIFIPGPTQCGLSRINKQAKHTTIYKFAEGIGFAEHWKLVAESSEFHLTLKRAHRVHFFQLEIRQKSGTF